MDDTPSDGLVGASNTAPSAASASTQSVDRSATPPPVMGSSNEVSSLVNDSGWCNDAVVDRNDMPPALLAPSNASSLAPSASVAEVSSVDVPYVDPLSLAAGEWDTSEALSWFNTFVDSSA